MKTFKKVLASTLAAAMVVTALPVTPANAAAAPKLSATKATLYVGQSKAITVKAIPSTWKSAKVTAKSSKKSVATVKTSKKKVTVKAVKAGTAKVTVKVTGKVKTKKGTEKADKTLKATITVKNPSLTLKAASEVAVGAKETVKATVKPASTKVTFSSSDDAIATVDATTGEVTGVKAGEVTITAKAGKTTKTVKMTVKDYIFKDVKQATTTKLTATVAGNTANLKASDFVITNTYSKANIAVKSVSVDATDKTQVIVETYVAMADGKDYTITLAGTTKTITVTDGKIATAAITPATVTVPTPADAADGSNANDIKITLSDANSVVIKTLGATDTALDGFAYVETKVDATNNGYLTGNKLNLYKAGNTAKVTFTAHSGKYDASAQEIGNITAEATITGVDAATVTTTGYNTKLVNGTTSATAFKDVKETKIAVGDRTITAYIQKATSDNKVAKVDTGYTFESSDVDVMTVVANSTKDITDATAVEVNAYKEGTAYIIVKDGKGNVVATLPVTIGAKRKAVSLTLDKTSFVFSDKTKADVTVKATAKDQYNEEYTIDTLTVTKANGAAVTATVAAPNVTITASNLEADDTTTAYVVKFGDLKAAFTVQIVKSAATATYDLVLDKDSVDAVIKADSTDLTINATVKGFDAKGIVSEASVDGYTFKVTKDGKDVTDDAAGTISGGVIHITDVSEGAQMANGTYVVTATSSDNKKVFTKTFTITNSQPVATATLTATKVKATDNKNLKDILEVTYNGKKLTSSEYSVKDDVAITTTTNFAEITLIINVGSNKVQQKVALGKTVVAE